MKQRVTEGVKERQRLLLTVVPPSCHSRWSFLPKGYDRRE